MNRKERSPLHRAVQALIDAEIAFSMKGAAVLEERARLSMVLNKARKRYRQLLDKHTEVVRPE